MPPLITQITRDRWQSSENHQEYMHVLAMDKGRFRDVPEQHPEHSTVSKSKKITSSIRRRGHGAKEAEAQKRIDSDFL